MGDETTHRTQNQMSHKVQQVIVCLIDSGLSIIHQSFEATSIDPDLFSALLTAHALMRRGEKYTGESLEPETYEIDEQVATMCYGRFLAGIAISDGPTDEKTMSRLMEFVQEFEDEYEYLLRNWSGDRTFFDQEWALRQLRDALMAIETDYRLHERAMSMTTNARQFRVVLLIRRFAGNEGFNMEALESLLIRELDVPQQHAQDYLSDLEVGGLIVPTQVQ